jgi:hypothetical protein
LLWGIYPSVPANRYVADVYVNGKRVDHKDQPYPPHGRINPKNLSPDAQVEITGFATNSTGQLNYGLLCRAA